MHTILRPVPTLKRCALWWVSMLLIVAIVLPGAPASAAPPAQAIDDTSVLRSCASIDEDAIQDELNKHTQQIFSDVRTRLNLNEIVARHWDALGMDEKLNEAAEAGIEGAKRETNGFARFLSGLNPATAEELAETVARHTFTSTPFTAALEELTTSVANEIEMELLSPTVKSYSAAIYCLQTFLDARYSQAMAEAFVSRLHNQVEDVEGIELSPNVLETIEGHLAGIVGASLIAVTLLTRKVIAELMEELGERIVGSLGRRIAGDIVKRILGRIGTEVIPIVGWILGAGLFVYDVWSNLDGALPAIKEGLVAPETKSHIQSEIVAQLDAELQLAEKLPTVAREVADTLYEEWRIVRGQMRTILDLAEQNADFDAFLKEIESGDSLDRLLAIVDVLPVETRLDTLSAAIANGALAKAISLPTGVVVLVRDTGSIEDAVAWGEIAGRRLNDLVSLEIHKVRAPDTFDHAHLDHVLALRDKWQAQRVLALTNAQLDPLVSLPVPVFADLAVKFRSEQLGWLADQLPTLSSDTISGAVDAVRSDPALLDKAMAAGTFCGVVVNCKPVPTPTPPGDDGGNDGETGWGDSVWKRITGFFSNANWLVWGSVGFIAVVIGMFALGFLRRVYRYAFGSLDQDERKRR